MKEFDHLVFIGRFQPFHVGHLFVVNEAFSRTDHVILLIGSANCPRSLKNPFSFFEREAYIKNAVTLEAGKTLTCLPLLDTLYNDHLWLQHAQKQVASVTKKGERIGIIGHDKDDSSYYLKLFPTWEFCAVPSHEGLSATPIRQAFFNDGIIMADKLPSSSVDFLTAFLQTEAYQHLKAEQAFIERYQASFSALPYPPTFFTVDALVVQAGHILVVRRGGEYGRGLLALAGGFVDTKETTAAAVVRELKEESGLDVAGQTPAAVEVFDAPSRSLRGRTVTTVFLYELTGEGLPEVAGGDDASEAFWLPVGELAGDDFFEDHYSIIVKMLGIW
ncbi:MAG: bifunctional nicotinamide-nucleotide adenylyltransferase/Nudix hydroxylase [Moraxella sp.]|nr:bifunctional nicotinamide-nucleotide adenylyltransferase/Nudix hydroxylase [Moraxella sp.]